MSKRYDLTVEPRETGRHNSRTLRTKKLIPAVIYGSTENKNVCIAENTVVKYNTRAFENALFNIKSDDKALNGVVVLMKEVVVHPVSRRPEHIDLFALDLKKTVRVNIEVRFEGKPIGLSEGGLLNIVNRQIEIECLPTEIPEGITADVTNLGVGDALHVSDLTLPKGFKLISSPEMTLAVVNVLEEEAAATPAAEAAAAAPAAGAAAPAAGAAAPAAGAAKAPAAPAKDKK